MTIGKTVIADLRHRIVLCSMQDVVEANGTMELTRKEVVETWARIRPFLTFGSKGSFIGTGGYTILDPPKTAHQTHWISIRFQHDLDVNSTA
jgi:head-tail adaptor